MHLQSIRNATLRLEYGGKTILIDPYLAPKHSLPSFTKKGLPISAQEVIADADLVVVSHLHSDYFDKVAQTLLPKNTALLCSPVDQDSIRDMGLYEYNRS